MTETELQQLVDAVAAKTAADAKAAADAAVAAKADKRAALFAKARAFLVHNIVGISVALPLGYLIAKVL
jgi:hypothetical protein